MDINFADITILVLCALTLLHPKMRAATLARRWDGWILDTTSLINHFILLPTLQVLIAFRLYSYLFPSMKGMIDFGWVGSLGAYMAIDYTWYWNHRLFHAKTPLWNLHGVHHQPEDLDIFASARNSLISPFFMVYFWLIPAVLFLAQDPMPFLAYAGVGLIINFWGHTRFNLPRGSMAYRAATKIFVLPEDHFWHHSAEQTYCNFGTVFNFWDKWHKTWHQPGVMPRTLGYKDPMPLWKKVLFPW